MKILFAVLFLSACLNVYAAPLGDDTLIDNATSPLNHDLPPNEKLTGDIDNNTLPKGGVTTTEDNATTIKDNATKELTVTDENYKETVQYDNPGYLKSRGMVGLYGFLPDFHSKTMQDSNIGGGGFIYYNVLNEFWGNLMVGLSSDYTFTKATRSRYTANMKLAPITLNVAYMTSSNMVNFWGGVGASYTFADLDIRNVTDVGGNMHRKALTTFWAADLFVGGEYIFTENPKFGAFFEFRYTFTQPVKVNVDFGDINLNDTMTLQRLRYTLGFAYHF